MMKMKKLMKKNKIHMLKSKNKSILIWEKMKNSMHMIYNMKKKRMKKYKQIKIVNNKR